MASDDGGDWVMVPDESTAEKSDEGSSKLQEEAAHVEQPKLSSETMRKEETLPGKFNLIKLLK